MTLRRLTRQEAEALPDGAKVRIIWSGGNGPFWYRVRIDKWGNRQVWTDREFLSSWVDSVSGAGIGLEKPATIVEIEE
jgi:hypothetical protein